MEVLVFRLAQMCTVNPRIMPGCSNKWADTVVSWTNLVSLTNLYRIFNNPQILWEADRLEAFWSNEVNDGHHKICAQFCDMSLL